MPKFNFGGPTYQARSPVEDCEDCLNLYPERPEVPGAQGTWPLYGTPGKLAFCTFGDSPCACVVPSNQFWVAPADTQPVAFAIYGSTLYSVTASLSGGVYTGTAHTIGTVDKRVLQAGQLVPAQIIVIGPTLLFVVANGQAWIAVYGTGIATSQISGNAVKNTGSGYVVGDTGFVNQPGGYGAMYTVTSVIAGAQGALDGGLTVVNGGSGYNVGDTGTLVGGNNDATYSVASVNTAANGQITSSGGGGTGAGYAVGDTGTVNGGNGDATYVITQVGVGPTFSALEYALTNQGTGYSPANGVATTPGGAQPGGGSGFVLDILAVSSGHGAVTAVNVVATGSGYTQGATVPTVPTSGSGSGLTVTLQGVNTNAGGVNTYTLTPGGGYTVANNVSTLAGGTQPGVGAGFVIDILSVSSAAWQIVKLNIPNGVPGLFIQSATYMDGYVIVSFAPQSADPFRRRFYISDLNNPTNWNPLFFGTKESGTDPIIAVYAAYEVLEVYGLSSIEQWYDSGGLFQGDIPFTRIQGGGVIENGLASPWCISTMDGVLCWLGSDGRGGYVAWTMRGLTPVRISNYAVEYQWRNYDVNGASSFSYQEGGHFFFVLNFPRPNTTWVCDTTTIGPDGKPQWHRRDYWNGSSSQADRGRYHAFDPGVGHMVGDYQSNAMYLQSVDYLDDAGTRINRLRIPPPLSNEQKRMLIQRFRWRIATGNVPSSGPGSSPIGNLRISHDSGKTWGNYIPMPLGLIGQYQLLVESYLHSLNRACALEITCNEPIQQAWVDGYVEYMLAQTQA